MIGLVEIITLAIHVGRRAHKSNKCPEKRVNCIITQPQAVLPTIIKGKIGNNPYGILLDTGADISTVHSKTVEPGEYLNKTIPINTVGGVSISMPLAKVWLHVADYSNHLTIAD